MSGRWVAQSSWKATNGLDPYSGQDPFPQPHAVRGSDDGLCVKCPLRGRPHWVCAQVPAEWVERYGERLEHERLPKEEDERKQYANQVGGDGWMLLRALEAPTTADW